MSLNIGIDHVEGNWKTCLAEDEKVLESFSFSDAGMVFSYIEQLCALYPEPIIGLSSPLETPLCRFNELPGNILRQTLPLEALQGGVVGPQRLEDLLIAIASINLKSHSLPAAKYLPGIPRHRKLYRGQSGQMGGSNKVCTVATLLYRMRLRDATWPELCFFYLEVSDDSHNILVVKEGRIIDALGKRVVAEEDGREEVDEATLEMAFWEELTQDLAGLVAIHHFEDVVIADHRLPANGDSRRDRVIDRLGDNYQFYFFPNSSEEPVGFEAARGAAILAEGLYRPGVTAEVAERLLLGTSAKP